MGHRFMCVKHRSYKGKSKPRSNCLPCWRQYLSEDPERIDNVTMKDMKNILLLIGDHRC